MSIRKPFCSLVFAGLISVVGLWISPRMPALAAGDEKNDRLNVDKVWKEFRSAYPYSMQSVAVQKGEDGEYVLVVSEPPPHVTRDDLQELLPGVQFKRQRVGYKGWVADAVQHGRMKPKDFDELIEDLHRLLFDTTYGKFVLQLPAKPQLDLERQNLDLKLHPGDLASWVNGANGSKPIRFAPLSGGVAILHSQIASQFSEVYHSDPPGLVGWWVPEKADLSACRAQIRHFAIDSDFVVGATKNDKGLLVIGRHRKVGLELMPPLRAETVILLGMVKKDELFQTINPQLLSCYVPLSPPQRWELNILSPELEDTEFGNLLTVADVLLKSWSLNGYNSVQGFRDYKSPDSENTSQKWPFPQPLVKHLKATSLVFNYDSGAASLLDVDSQTMSVVRTGVLPLAYFPDRMAGPMPPAVAAAERDGYDWFGHQADPHILRVAQYTAILQSFNAFRPNTTAKKTNALSRLDAAKRKAAEELLEAVRKPDVDLDQLVERLVNSAHSRAIDKPANAADVRAWLEGLRNKPEAEAREFTKRLERPGLLLPHDTIELPSARKKLFEKIISLYKYAPLLASSERFDDALASHLSTQARGWIHTPVLIFDLNTGPIARFAGGHRIKAASERVRRNPNVAPGKIQKGSDGTWEVRDGDYNRLVIRGRNRAPTLLSKAPPRRPLGEVLDVAGMKVDKAKRRWWQSGPALTKAERAVIQATHAKRPQAVVVLRRTDGTFILHNAKKAFRAKTYRQAIDRLVDTTGGRKRLDLELAGLTIEESEALGASLMNRRHALSRAVYFTVTRIEKRPGLPSTFRLSEYEASTAKVTVQRFRGASAEGEIRLAAKEVGKPEGRVAFSIRGRNHSMDQFKWPQNELQSWIREAWTGAKDLKHFQERLRGRIRAELKRMSGGLESSDPKVNLRVFQQTRDKYYTRVYRKHADSPERKAA